MVVVVLTVVVATVVVLSVLLSLPSLLQICPMEWSVLLRLIFPKDILRFVRSAAVLSVTTLLKGCKQRRSLLALFLMQNMVDLLLQHAAIENSSFVYFVSALFHALQ